MTRYSCEGWLHIEVQPGKSAVTIRVKHSEHHVAYLDISLPEEWKQYIDDMAASKTPGQVCLYTVTCIDILT